MEAKTLIWRQKIRETSSLTRFRWPKDRIEYSSWQPKKENGSLTFNYNFSFGTAKSHNRSIPKIRPDVLLFDLIDTRAKRVNHYPRLEACISGPRHKREKACIDTLWTRYWRRAANRLYLNGQLAAFKIHCHRTILSRKEYWSRITLLRNKITYSVNRNYSNKY